MWKSLRGSKSIEQGQAGLRSVAYKERPDEWERVGICQTDKICEKVAIKQTITKSLKKHQKRC